ncbi:MAG TPA: glutamine amidotransferase [Thermodesulfobacteriota bacterium]|nr:glutamine amidotransferase [Thermodesulfobacteriota bacterium]
MNQYVERFVFLNPIGFVEGVIILLLLFVISYGALRDIKRLTTLKKRVILVSLRSASFLLIAFILLNPALRTETYKETKPNLAILVDNSWSMNLAGGKEETSRIQGIRNYFKDYRDFFSRVEKNFHTSYYVFDESLNPASIEAINSDEPNGKSTDIGKAIEELEKKYDSGELDSVILFSDGADNGRILKSKIPKSPDQGSDRSSTKLGIQALESAQTSSKTWLSSAEGLAENLSDDFLKKIRFPISTVASALQDELPDVWIENVKVSEVAFVRYPLSVEVEVRSSGFEIPNFPVTLEEWDVPRSQSSSKIISTQQISLAPQESNKLEFILRPKSVGRKIYTVSVPTLSGESVKENNKKSFVVDVIIDKIRVLHVAGNPSWDVRFLRKVLKRNPNVDLVSFFILRDASDSVFASQDEISLIPFPVDEIFDKELETFDVVIFHNFYFRPYGIYDYHLRNLKRYVEDGGAFIMIGGMNSFDSGGYGRTPLSDILPVELNLIPRMIQDTFNTKSFRVELTQVGLRHPVMKVDPNKQGNEALWEEMPELEGYNKVEGLKSHTLPLLVTSEGEPILVLNKVQSGKVASFLSDSSWKWGFVRGGEGEVAPYYEEFWNRLHLWLVNDPELKDIRVTTDKVSYNPGERIKVNARVIEYENREGKIESRTLLPSGMQKEMNLKKNDADGFSSGIQTDEYGAYKLKVVVKKGFDIEKGVDFIEEEIGDETVFLVEPPSEEIRGPNTNQALLEIIAKKTEGKAITIRDNPEKLGISFSPKRTITGYKTVEIWDNPWFFIVVLTLLSADWMLRRRWGLR